MLFHETKNPWRSGSMREWKNEKACLERCRLKTRTFVALGSGQVTSHEGAVDRLFHTLLSFGTEFALRIGSCWAHKPYVFRVLSLNQDQHKNIFKF